jgi:hypothetical protein
LCLIHYLYLFDNKICEKEKLTWIIMNYIMLNILQRHLCIVMEYVKLLIITFYGKFVLFIFTHNNIYYQATSVIWNILKSILIILYRWYVLLDTDFSLHLINWALPFMQYYYEKSILTKPIKDSIFVIFTLLNHRQEDPNSSTKWHNHLLLHISHLLLDNIYYCV